MNSYLFIYKMNFPSLAKVSQENNFMFRRKLKPGNFRFHEQDIDYRMQAYRTVIPQPVQTC